MRERLCIPLYASIYFIYACDCVCFSSLCPWVSFSARLHENTTWWMGTRKYKGRISTRKHRRKARLLERTRWWMRARESRENGLEELSHQWVTRGPSTKRKKGLKRKCEDFSWRKKRRNHTIFFFLFFKVRKTRQTKNISDLIAWIVYDYIKILMKFLFVTTEHSYTRNSPTRDNNRN